MAERADNIDVIENVNTIIADFKRAYGLDAIEIAHEAQPGPHAPHSLPKGTCAVYVFSLSPSCGGLCDAGPNRALKVGKAGPKSNARFQSQHYHPNSARSNLAKGLLESRGRWHYLGINNLVRETIGQWICQHLDRDNFYLDATKVDLLNHLEKYLKARLGPVFEGG